MSSEILTLYLFFLTFRVILQNVSRKKETCQFLKVHLCINASKFFGKHDVTLAGINVWSRLAVQFSLSIFVDVEMDAVFEQIRARAVIQVQALVALVKLAAEVVDFVDRLAAADDAAHRPDDPAVAAVIRELIQKVLNFHFEVVDAARHDAALVEKNSHRRKASKRVFVAVIVAAFLRADQIFVEIAAKVALDVVHANGFGG